MPIQKKKAVPMEQVEEWSQEEVNMWLMSMNLDQFQDQFKANDITGYELLRITPDDVKAMNCTDKKKKAMKKALGTLSGNSISKKTKSKKESKEKSKASPAQQNPEHHRQAPPPLPDSRSRNPSSAGPPPPLPPSSSHPPFHHQQHLQQRKPLPPPAPFTTPPEEDLYDDPSMSALDYETSIAGNVPPMDKGQEMVGGDGFLPQEPSEIYDCVNDMEGEACPPPILPPHGNGAASSDEIEQDIYIEGDEGNEDMINDSFEDSSNNESDDYLSPFEDDDDDLQEEAAADEDPPRMESDAIRMLKGKFFAHGLTKHTGLDPAGSLPPRPTEGRGPINEELVGVGSDDEGDIYDIVPEEFKEDCQQVMAEEDEEADIYDTGPGAGGEDPQPSPSWSIPTSIKLPPKPKLSAPIPSQHVPPPDLPSYRKPFPPALPPSRTNGMEEEEEEEEEIYDEGVGEDPGYVEDVYDVPDEVEERAKLAASVAHSTPAPKPLKSPPSLLHEEEAEEEEDIYDTPPQDKEEQRAPSPMPPLPARPSKPGNVSSNPTFMKKPPTSPPFPPTSKSPFSKASTANRSFGSKPPAEAPPMSPPMSPPSPPAPKTSLQPRFLVPAKPPLPTLPPTAVGVPLPPRVPTLDNTSTKPKEPAMKGRIASLGGGGVSSPPPRPPSELKPVKSKPAPASLPSSLEERQLQERLSKLNPSGSSAKPPPSPFIEKSSSKEASGTTPSFLNAVKLKPVAGKGKSVLVKSEADTGDSVSSKPRVSGSMSKQVHPPPGGSGGGMGRATTSSSSLNKPGTSPKISKISNLMKQFETKGGQAGNEENEEIEEPSPSPLGSSFKPPSHVAVSSSSMMSSPLSGRRIDRKSSVEDLTKKFGGRTRSTSPDNKTFLQPKSSSGDNPPSMLAKVPPRSPSPKPGMKKPPVEKAATPARPEPKVKDEEEEDDRPPSAPPPSRPPTKKEAGKSWEKKDTGPSIARLPPKKPMVGGKPPLEEKEEMKPAPPWLKKPAEQEEKQQQLKPSTETSVGTKGWKKEPHKLLKEPPAISTTSSSLRKRSSASEPVSQETSTVPASPQGCNKQFAYRPYRSKDRSISNSETTSTKDIPNSGSRGRTLALPDRNTPMGNRAPVISEENVPALPSKNSPDAVPGRNPPPLHKPPPEPENKSLPSQSLSPEPESSGPSLPSRNTISPPQPDNSAPSLPNRNLPSYIPPSEPEHMARDLPSRNPPSHRQPPEPKSFAPALPSRNKQPPPESGNAVPNLPSRNPPSYKSPAEPDNLAPSLPSRNPPTHRQPSEPPENLGAPSLPGRNPASTRPADAGPPARMLPPPISEFESSSLPPNKASTLPPAVSDFPTTKPPDIPKRVPDPIPAGAEPSLPARPSKNISATSPANQSWYHANLDRKHAEAMLKRYSKDGTFVIRDSTKIIGEYSLSLLFGGGIRHLRIRLRPDKKFVLGEEKSDENVFDTVMGLVEHHKCEPLHLKSGGETLLKFECPH